MPTTDSTPHQHVPSATIAPQLAAWLALALMGISATLLAGAWITHRRLARTLGPTQAPAITVPVLSPAESLARVQVQPDFRFELIASEPMVEAPVAAAFDELGRMWVVEMRTYMPDIEGTGELEARNRIVILEDTDHDGVMDTSTVFMDDLVLPRAVAPCHGGALVIEPPHLLFCKDTDGDGRADVRQVLLDGFAGIESPEHAGNGLIYGIDNWWELSQHSMRLGFDGQALLTQKTPSHGQWGVTRDDSGRLYYTPNSSPLLVDLFPKQYASRPGASGSAAGLGESVAKDGATWPAIPTPTVNRGYREGTLRADGTLASVTAACGPSILRTPALGADFEGDALVCEPAGQLIKRLKISRKEDSLDAANFYKDGEFARSADERFRPVNSLIGPDGNVYILDMYRGLIQHRMFLTPHLKEITRSRGMEAPVNCGRIWRISRTGQPAIPQPTMPGEMTSRQLVDTLSHPVGWWRDTAQRLLVERHAVEIADQLRGIAMDESRGEQLARLHAAWALHGMRSITEDDVRMLSDSQSPALRTVALRLSEHLAYPDLIESLAARGLGDPDPAVRVQAALSIGALPVPRRIPLSATAYHARGHERLVKSALKTGIAGHELDVLDRLLAFDDWPGSNEHGTVLRELVDAVLNGSSQQRASLANLAGSLVLREDPRAEKVLDRFKSKLRLDADEPSPLKLAESPDEWLAASQTDLAGASLMRDCTTQLEWPGHDVAKRARIVRDLTPQEWDQFERGKTLFIATCAGCHQLDGSGSPGMAPALAGSGIASGPGHRMARVLLQGLEGGYMPGGGSWAVMPPPTGRDSGELAAIMTFVRRSWGNTGDPVTPAMVARAREKTKGRDKPWTRDELNGVKE